MDAKSEVVKLLAKAAGLSEPEVSEILEVPPNPELGDFALPCFTLAAKLRKAPQAIAAEIKNKIKLPKNSIAKEVKVAGAYLNLFLNEEVLAKQIIEGRPKLKPKPSEARLGAANRSSLAKQNKTIVIEFISPNTNKPLHLGHLRNASLGDSVSRIFGARGYKVIRACLNSDRGVHICKSMLAYQKWGGSKTPESEKIKSDHFVGDYYVRFAKSAAENPKLEEEAQQMLQRWEAGDKKTWALWKKMDAWAKAGFRETYKTLGIKFDKFYNESENYGKGKDIVLQNFKKGIFVKDDKGNIVADLAKYNLPNKVVLRADGTAVYVTQDLFLAERKWKEYKPAKSIYVVASEQNLHFQQLFAILDILKSKIGEIYHLSYGMVYLPEGRMKSREGTVVDTDDLIEEVKAAVKLEIEARHDHEFSDKKMDRLALQIALGAIKYFLLKFDAKSDITFDPKKSVSLEGDTGPYLQYALVRAKKILEKAGKVGKADYGLLKAKQESALVKKLAGFSAVVEKSAKEYSPHYLAIYCRELADLFNSFYEACPVIAAESEGLRNVRLKLVQAFAQVLRNALYLLGIEEVEVM